MRRTYASRFCVAIMAGGMCAVGGARAGSLDATNTPAPTMHTLEEVYQKASAVLSPAAVAKTGQTNSFRLGDDGDRKMGLVWPSQRFTVQSDTNVVVDNLTGLMWARNAFLAGTQTWEMAVGYCTNLIYGGYDDWRLPNRSELISLLDYGRSVPMLPLGHPFANVQLADEINPSDEYYSEYWSSTTHVGYPECAWVVSMRTGRMGRDGKGAWYPVWPVRGGQ